MATNKFLPAGKKLFIITTLTFTAGLILFRQIRYLAHKRLQPAPVSPPTSEVPLSGTKESPVAQTPPPGGTPPAA